MKTALWRVLALLAVLQACRQADSVVLVNVDAETGVPPVTAIRVTMSTVKTHDAKVFPAQTSAAPVHFPASLVLRIPRSRSGRLDLVLEGLNAASETVASGTAETVIAAGGQVTVYTVLTPGPRLCGNGVIDPGEECDDSNLVSFDGCDFRCRAEGVGPDAGVVDGATPDIEVVDGMADAPVDKSIAETARDSMGLRDSTVDAGLPDAPRVADAAPDRMEAGTGGTAGVGGMTGMGGTTNMGGTTGMGGTGGGLTTGKPGGSTGSNTTGTCPGTGGPTMVRLPEGYCIDSTEVTRAQYQAWLASKPSADSRLAICKWSDFPPDASCMNDYHVCRTNCDDHPQVCVNWCQALTYCLAVGKRLCGKIGGGSWLPTDTAVMWEWYNACSSAGANYYPYGNTYVSTTCNGYDYWGRNYNKATTAAVATFPGCQASGPYAGVFDLGGNVAEWDDRCGGSGQEAECRVHPASFDSTGGCDYDSATVKRRDYVANDLGFRCCAQ